MGAFLCSVVLLVGNYFLDSKSLRKYPGPKSAAFTSLWQMYCNNRGEKFLAVHSAHEKYGKIVRLGPNHLSFSSPQAFKDIYGHGTTVKKDVFYDNQAAGNPNMADATNKEIHRGKRKNLAHVFSPGQITAMEPRVMEVATKLVYDIEKKSKGQRISETDRFGVKNGVFDLRPWLNMFSYDAITAVFWSSSYGFLDRGNDDCIAESRDGSHTTVNAMHAFHTGAAHSVLLGHLTPFWYDLLRNRVLGWSHATICGNAFTDMARHLAKKRLSDPPLEPDLFSNFPTKPTAKRDAPMSMDEIIAESAVMLNAGNDTTQSSLTNTMYFLAKHPQVQDKLRRLLLEAVLHDTNPVTSYDKVLRHVPYLRAVIDESFRLQAPLGTGLPRMTTKPLMIDGEMVQAGVTVSA